MVSSRLWLAENERNMLTEKKKNLLGAYGKRKKNIQRGLVTGEMRKSGLRGNEKGEKNQRGDIRFLDSQREID